jgi:Kef-type K+ transport system membrane component KefB
MGEFLGRSLFIPIFFVVTGFLINPITLVYGIFDNFLLVACIIGALLVGKWIAASRMIRSVQSQRLLDDRMLNVMLLLVFATSVLGPFD